MVESQRLQQRKIMTVIVNEHAIARQTRYAHARK